jgi:N-acetylneuraminic acid mutarotase
MPPTPVPALGPSARGYVSMAYDSESDQIILFGGQTGSGGQYSSETWAYDVATNKWTEMKPPAGPSKRAAADLAYDAESDRMIMFDGVNADTWAYDFNTNTWQEMTLGPAGALVAFLGCRLAYDAESDRVILFGGYNFIGMHPLNETWSYDYNSDTWTQMKPSDSPTPRSFHAMAYDAESDRVIIWGGGENEKEPNVWAYDYNKNTWEKMPYNGGPSDRFYTSMVYDAKMDRMILYGGPDDDQTWSYNYNANRWTKLSPPKNPGIRLKYAITYSESAGRVILFGGQKGEDYVYSDETWSYDLKANTWTNMTLYP